MESITFFLDFPLPTLNEMIRTARGNKFASAAQKKKYTELVATEIMVQTERPHFNAISLDITWIETKKKRDPDNVFTAVKFILDGMVAADIIRDDDRDHVVSITNRIAASYSRGVAVMASSVPKPLYTITYT
jgi:Holliday junction resolvase RusA-like endonuclease